MMKSSMERTRFAAGSAGIAVVALILGAAQFVASIGQLPLA